MGAENDAKNHADAQAITTAGTLAKDPHHDGDNNPEGELDDFGLPKRPQLQRTIHESEDSEEEDDADTFHDAEDIPDNVAENRYLNERSFTTEAKADLAVEAASATVQDKELSAQLSNTPRHAAVPPIGERVPPSTAVEEDNALTSQPRTHTQSSTTSILPDQSKDREAPSSNTHSSETPVTPTPTKRPSGGGKGAVSEWSHQRLASHAIELDPEAEEAEEWQAMPALAEFDIYDDDGKLVAKGTPAVNEEEAAYGHLGGAGKGYTRVQLDEDAQSATSMDEDTKYLFKEGGENLAEEEDERDAASQLQATKDLLTEGQRIAYVGVTRLTMYNMVKELQDMEGTKGTKKDLVKAVESMTKWGQQVMVRVYAHMDIDPAEQIMIEQLAEHLVQPRDLVPPLMQNSRVKNPMADDKPTEKPPSKHPVAGAEDSRSSSHPSSKIDVESEPLPLYEAQKGDQTPEVQSPAEMTRTAKIDLDLRWTVLCDLFLVLLADSTYDARSRRLLEQVAAAMEISWVQICRFEKRIIDALQLQEEAAKENWNEEDHMESRRKMGLKHKYMVMGLATVGGGLVIGLSAGLLAPVIGAGLAAGFTTIGVTGTAGFLSGVGGAALITSAATAAGGTIAVRASARRTGAVQTFEYRPLHNNKRVNLIVTVSGWMIGKVDDVRLPYSTIDPIMGDIYSLLWEPEMLQSMGDTINILATEALTQTVQQVLGSTILVALMASLQLPIILTKLSYLIDNPWTVSLDRANAAGLILADSLIDRHLGNRPITLLGFSLGSRLIFSCLKELANRGAFGLVQNVYLFGSPIVAKRDEYIRARSIISGRFVNGYASNDWILGYLFRATSGGIMRVAGLASVEGVPGLENLDVTSLVSGHMAYRAAMPRLLREVGWEVESDEFSEIEDPDPENHQKRQRELIREIDEARRDAETKPEKKIFGFFKRGKMAEKKGWETYNNNANNKSMENIGEASSGLSRNVLFDIDAIRRELESEMIEVKQLESTLPPMQISTKHAAAPNQSNGQLDSPPFGALRQTKSSDASMNGENRIPRLKQLEQQPRGLLPEEFVKLSLPPRPDEIDDDHVPVMKMNSGEGTTPPLSNTNFEPEFDFSTPRELKTTLPPLTLSPPILQESWPRKSMSPPQQPPVKSIVPPPMLSPPISQDSWPRTSTSPPQRPPLKSHITMPASVNHVPTSTFGSMNLDHNAWADDDDDYGKERQMSMTFE